MREFDLLVDHHGHARHLFCDVEEPLGDPHGTVLIAHGFKGYKDYGMFPRLARFIARLGWAAVRFNFAHSGMTRNAETFERPDLFSLDTWDAQVRDLGRLVEAVRGGELSSVAGAAPVVLFGHSRGGVASLLAAGRGLDVDLVFSLAAPAEPCRLSDEHRQCLAEGTGVEVRSDRTGQTLLIGPQFLAQIERAPEEHDLLAMAERVSDRLVVVHGLDDATVSADDARALAERAGVEPHLLPGGNHVMNVANPFDPEEVPSPQLAAVESLLERQLQRLARRADPSR